jgi:TatD DNase family protein
MIDTHAHLADIRYNDDRDIVIKRFIEAGVKKILCICCDFSELEIFRELINKYSFIYGAIGVHPHDASRYTELLENKSFLSILENPRIVAIGEIGLDYHYDTSLKDAQQIAFRIQLKIAKERNLPVIIHSREAIEDTIRILTEENVSKGVMHCFSGNETDLKKCLDLGLYISFAGPLTFPNAGQLRKTAASAPLDRIMLETDCPYLAPQEVRGQRNEPVFVKYIYNKLSLLKTSSAEILINQIELNVKTLFGI